MNDFNAFYNAMKAEYMRHHPEKGDSWKNDFYYSYFHRYSSMPPARISHPQDDYLIELLDEIYKKWKESGDVSELIDMANVQAMIWTRVQKTLSQFKEDPE